MTKGKKYGFRADIPANEQRRKFQSQKLDKDKFNQRALEKLIG